jgi:hypothetical protein
MNSNIKNLQPRQSLQINGPAPTFKRHKLHEHLLFWMLPLWICMMFHSCQIYAQHSELDGLHTSINENKTISRKLFGYEITNMGYGGPAIKLSQFNNQLAFMTGGRGGCIINHRFTLGGGGYGIASTVNIPGSQPDTLRYFKMGYGGIEGGYIFFAGRKMHIGGSLLVAAGAAFWLGNPKSKHESVPGNDLTFLPVLEPSIYTEIALNRFMWLHIGISYRYINHSEMAFISDKNMRGFSCYLGVLFGQTN